MQIEVQAVHPPGPGRKTGTVVDREGQRYECWPEKLEQLAVGHAYDVEISEREYDGRVIRKIAKVKKAQTLFTTPWERPTVNDAPANIYERGRRKPVDPLEIQFVAACLRTVAPLPPSAIESAVTDFQEVYRRRFVEG